MADSFDVVIIGSGTGGYVAAIRAAQAKAAAEMQTEMHKLAGGLGLPPGMLPQ